MSQDDNGYPGSLGLGVLVGLLFGLLLGSWWQSVKANDLLRTQVATIDRLERTTATVERAVRDLDRNTARLMRWSIAIALVAAVIGAVVAKLL